MAGTHEWALECDGWCCGQVICLRALLESGDGSKASLIAQPVKNLPAVRETWVQFLDWEEPLEKEMATHSSILAWRIPWIEEPGRLQSTGSQELDTTERLNHHHHGW